MAGLSKRWYKYTDYMFQNTIQVYTKLPICEDINTQFQLPDLRNIRFVPNSKTRFLLRQDLNARVNNF